MNGPTPRDIAPTRRIEAVAEVLASLDAIEDLPLDQEAARLAEAQTMLAKVLNNEPIGRPGDA